MRKLVLSNFLIAIIVWLFFQVNGSMYSYIYFNPAQSLFTRNDYLVLFFIGLSVLSLLGYILNRLRKRIDQDSYRKLLFFELFILFILGFVCSIAYIYFVFNPNLPIITVLVWIPVYRKLVIWYFFELAYFVYMINSFQVFKNTVSNFKTDDKKSIIFKILELILFILILITPIYIDHGEWSISLVEAGFIGKYWYLFTIAVIAYLMYIAIPRGKGSILSNMVILLILLTMMIIYKNPIDYFMTESLHVGSKPFISFYLLMATITLNITDSILLYKKYILNHK